MTATLTTAPPPTPSRPTTTGYAAAILVSLARRDATVLDSDAGPLTGAELAAQVVTTANRLRDNGVTAGTVVALLTAPNHPAMLIGRYAAHLLGVTVVHLRSMNPRTDEDELPVTAQLDVLAATAATVILADDASAARAVELADRRPGLVVVALPTGADTILLATADADDLAVHVTTDPRACAVIDFTSGTTNAPRLVRQSYAARARLLRRLAGDLPAQSTRFLSVTPVSHTTAPMVDAAFLRGGTVLLHSGFDADAVLDATEAGVTDVYLAVPHLMSLLDHPRTATADLSGLRRVVYSGTPAAPARVAAAAERFGSTLVQVYGSTETGGISALTPEDHAEPLLQGTVGRPFPWVEVELRDPETGAVVDTGRTGSVWVRSETCADGYWDDAELTARFFTSGWVDTGDLGAWDPHGRLRLVGRVGGVIKHGGIKIYPHAIEQALLEHPSVAEVVVQGIRDPERREHVHAVVVPHRSATVSEEELSAFVADRLSPVHAPTRIVQWRGIPLMSSGKTDRRLVRELLGG